MKRNLIFAVITAALTCPLTGLAQTVNISNGVAGVGHLDVNVDAYGAFGNFNPAYADNFQPSIGGTSQPSFTAGFRLFSGTDRVLLTDMPEWIAVFAAVPGTWTRSITSPVSNVNSSTASSSFNVLNAAGSPRLSFDVTQTAVSHAAGVAVLDQNYEITNVSGGPLNFTLNRPLDGDLVWDGDFLSDHVAASNPLGFVSLHEPGSITQAIALTSGPGGLDHNFYWGAKNTHVPTGGPPAMGFGTDLIVWNNLGLPITWRNYVAFAGYDNPGGDSGLVLQDAHIGLDWVISLANGGVTNVNVRTVYGAGCLIGDVNGDGFVTLLDVNPFVNILTAGGFNCAADTNQDGTVTLLDVSAFVNILTGP